MDRRKQHRALLSRKVAGLVAVVWGFARLPGGTLAQTAPGQNVVPTPNSSATPWVQASPPVAAPPSPTPPAASKPVPTPGLKKEPTPPVQNGPKPGARDGPPGPAPKPPAAHGPPPAPPNRASVEEAKAKMLLERQRELDPSSAFEPPTATVEEQGTYGKTARFYRDLSPEEQGLIRVQAAKRIREELDAAYRRSGLTLSENQREVFELRYRQERRQLEQEIQEKARNERSRRMPQIIDQLKKEFEQSSLPGLPKASQSPATPSFGATPLPAPGSAVDGAEGSQVEARTLPEGKE